jgi:CRP/FNR family transcriptional regulator, cyclic AMP receptor protein
MRYYRVVCVFQPNKANEHTVGDDAFEEVITALPLATYRAGESVLVAGSKSGRLLILKTGAVVVLKDSVEIARVDLPHTADVRALEDSQFHVADAALPSKNPVVLFQVAKILARRIVTANRNLVELKNKLQEGQSPRRLSKMLEKVQEVLSIGGASFET